MTHDTSKPLGAPEHLDLLARDFLAQATILRDIPLLKLPDRLQRSFVLIEAIISASIAVHRLASQGFTTEVYVVLRAFLERVVTLFYLVAASDEEFENYTKYSIQKTYRKMDQSLQVGGETMAIKFSGEIDLTAHPELKSAVDRFTSAKGRPITRWSNTSIESKLEVIAKANITNIKTLMLSVLTFYDDCSEALHATLYGCTFHRGIFEPGKSPKTKEEWNQSHLDGLAVVFILGTGTLYEVNKYLFGQCGADDLLKRSELAWKEFGESVQRTLCESKKNEAAR